MTAAFQSVVNPYNSAATPGDLAYNSPIRSTPYNLDSDGTPQYIGNAFTVVNGGNPNTSAGAPLAGTAKVGGAAGTLFAGILVNSKEYASYGVTGAPLGATLALPDNSIGNLVTMGEVWCIVDNQPDIGDLVTYDPATGSVGTTTTSYTIHTMLQNPDDSQLATGQYRVDQVLAMVSAEELGIEPTPNDKITIDGVDWNVSMVSFVSSGEFKALFTCVINK